VAYGKVTNEERETILEHFKKSNKVNVIFLTSIGDAGIDLPNANVVI
jgi:superfamily II DNA or RNA helicase